MINFVAKRTASWAQMSGVLALMYSGKYILMLDSDLFSRHGLCGLPKVTCIKFSKIQELSTLSGFTHNSKLR